jgi:hypothetical protein
MPISERGIVASDEMSGGSVIDAVWDKGGSAGKEVCSMGICGGAMGSCAKGTACCEGSSLVDMTGRFSAVDIDFLIGLSLTNMYSIPGSMAQ